MSKFSISKITAREIIDCRGWPTVQADVWVDGKLMGRADVPAGRSTGAHEAHELRDGDAKRYKGLGVLKAVENVKKVIQPALAGMDVIEQRKIDMAMKSFFRSRPSLSKNRTFAASPSSAPGAIFPSQ